MFITTGGGGGGGEEGAGLRQPSTPDQSLLAVLQSDDGGRGDGRGQGQGDEFW